MPLLCLSGERELHPRLAGFAREVSQAAVNSPSTHWAEVDKADHTHAGRFEEAADLILQWLEELQVQPDLQPTAGA